MSIWSATNESPRLTMHGKSISIVHEQMISGMINSPGPGLRSLSRMPRRRCIRMISYRNGPAGGIILLPGVYAIGNTFVEIGRAYDRFRTKKGHSPIRINVPLRWRDLRHFGRGAAARRTG